MTLTELGKVTEDSIEQFRTARALTELGIAVLREHEQFWKDKWAVIWKDKSAVIWKDKSAMIWKDKSAVILNSESLRQRIRSYQ
jgi:hypothetical protein